jgi:molybdate transport system substrate-binding protein
MRLILLISAVILLSFSAAAQPSRVLVVFAAASLTDAFEDLREAFIARNPGVDILYEFGSSSALAAQLMEGAEADIFASANLPQVHNVVEAGLASSDASRWFATNTLVIIVRQELASSLTNARMLARPGLAVVIANADVPIRVYTDELLQTLDALYGADYADTVLANVVSEEENVRRLVTKVVLGEADASIVYRTDVTPDIADELGVVELPAGTSPIAQYPLVVLANSPQPELARAFVDFMLGDEGQGILATWGFCPPINSGPALAPTPEATPETTSEATPEPAPEATAQPSADEHDCG